MAAHYAPYVTLILAVYAQGASGHGAMNIPPSRNAGEGWKPGDNVHGCNSAACMWFSQGCTIGCPCNGDNSDLIFFRKYCDSPQEPTVNDPAYLTYSKKLPLVERAAVLLEGGDPDNWTRYHPWRAPGTAITYDACGLSGGSYRNNDAAAGFGKETIVHQQGYNGSRLPPVSYQTVWRANSTVEVAWGVTANHGGCLLYTSPSPRDRTRSRMPSSA